MGKSYVCACVAMQYNFMPASGWCCITAGLAKMALMPYSRPAVSNNVCMINVSIIWGCDKVQNLTKLEMWANAQRDSRPAEYRWRPLLNAAVWLTPTTRVPCSNTAKTRNPLKVPGVPQTNEKISAASGPKFTILWGHVGEMLLLNKFFSDCRYVP